MEAPVYAGRGATSLMSYSGQTAAVFAMVPPGGGGGGMGAHPDPAGEGTTLSNNTRPTTPSLSTSMACAIMCVRVKRGKASKTVRDM